jgi:hypothetical protein
MFRCMTSRFGGFLLPGGPFFCLCHDGRLELVTAVDDIEQQVGVAIAVGEVPHFIDLC